MQFVNSETPESLTLDVYFSSKSCHTIIVPRHCVVEWQVYSSDLAKKHFKSTKLGPFEKRIFGTKDHPFLIRFKSKGKVTEFYFEPKESCVSVGNTTFGDEFYAHILYWVETIVG